MTRGMLSEDQLRSEVGSGGIDTVIVAFTDHFGRLMGKRFDAEFFLESCVTDGTHGCDYLLTVDMEMEPIEGYEYANWEKGYGDFHLVPDLDVPNTLVDLGVDATTVDTIAAAAVDDPSAGTNPITIDHDFTAAVFAAACEGRLD